MFIAEPPASQGDLHFRLFGFPIRVHPFFWVVGVLLTLWTAESLGVVLIFVSVLFVSILVHEMGHALAYRYFGADARIVLYAFGGLAIAETNPYASSYNRYDEPYRRPRNAILISLAGPAAGFLLAAAVVAALYAMGRYAYFGIAEGVGRDIGLTQLQGGRPLPSYELQLVVFYLLTVNIFWGLINLLPVYPLDGGQVSRELLQLADPRRGIFRSLWLSVGCGAAMAVLALVLFRSPFMAILFGYLAFSSYRIVDGYRRGYGGGYDDGYERGDRDW